MSQDHQAPQAQENRLVDPNVPADQGLSTLGLLMQLAGSIFAGYGALILFTFMMMPGGRGGEKGMMLLIAAASVARSVFHRMAGGDLLYRRQTLDGQASPLAGIKRYVLVALGHTLLLGLIFKFKLKLDGKFVFASCAGLALWPAVLAGLMQLPRFRRFQTDLPVPEDKGFEGASVLMTVLGACGALGSGLVLYLMVAEMDGLLQHGVGILVLIAVVMLFIRSIFHVQAGLSGLRETNLDRSVELANRYANFGVLASFCAAGALLLVFMMGRPNVVFIALVSGGCWLLLAWPMIIRRFFSDRQFVDLMAGEGASVHRRAPDSGLTGLGWLLFGMAMFSASITVPQVIMGETGQGNEMTEMMFMMAPAGLRSIWWSVGLVALQAWAGYELIRMSPHSRIIGSVFAVAAVLMAIYVNWPMLKAMAHIMRQPKMVAAFIPIAIQLVVPIATLVLVNRKITPTAMARYKPSGASQG
ncbi:MAG: hypothetical protein SFX73_39650 [Kofleriaceae bacterium]|nr:hypothetical protein [Kofleriaceae bacterium]